MGRVESLSLKLYMYIYCHIPCFLRSRMGFWLWENRDCTSCIERTGFRNETIISNFISHMFVGGPDNKRSLDTSKFGRSERDAHPFVHTPYTVCHHICKVTPPRLAIRKNMKNHKIVDIKNKPCSFSSYMWCSSVYRQIWCSL